MHAHKNAKDFDTYKNIFLDSCFGAQCSIATHGILNTIDANSSFLQCDIMTILYEGDPNGDFYQGVRGQVTSKAAYLTTLITMGITVESAYQSLVNNDRNAWKIVQTQFTAPLQGTIKHI